MLHLSLSLIMGFVNLQYILYRSGLFSHPFTSRFLLITFFSLFLSTQLLGNWTLDCGYTVNRGHNPSHTHTHTHPRDVRLQADEMVSLCVYDTLVIQVCVSGLGSNSICFIHFYFEIEKKLIIKSFNPWPEPTSSEMKQILQTFILKTKEFLKIAKITTVQEALQMMQSHTAQYWHNLCELYI